MQGGVEVVKDPSLEITVARRIREAESWSGRVVQFQAFTGEGRHVIN